MGFTLLFWSVIAAGNTSVNRHDRYMGWRPIISVSTAAACHNAASTLGIKTDYRCIDNKTGKES